MHVAHCTACPHSIQFGATTSAVFYVLHAVVRPALHHLQTSNANANRAQVPPHRTVSGVMKLKVAGKRCQTSCNTCRSTTMGLYSHVALLQCAFSTLLVDFHTIYDQPGTGHVFISTSCLPV